MTAEQDAQEPQEGEPSESQAGAEAAERPLNRAERRAQAHGKKGTNQPQGPLSRYQGNVGPGGRGPGGASRNRLPRTGHK